MSTRCQLQVIQQDPYTIKVTLYHHHDGYPEYMIPVIYRAYTWVDESDSNGNWVKGRAGKVASLLCWAEPTEFEPEAIHNLHGDIEFYYRLYCDYSYHEKKVIWEIDIYHRQEWHDDIYRKTTLSDFKLIESRQNIEDLVKKYNGAEHMNFSAIK
jgi:hypothetical protein